MAIIQNPIIGRARKSAGGMVFATLYENNVMRAKPISVKNPNTPAQQRQREFIADLTAIAKMASPDLLIELFPNPVSGRSRYSEFQRQLAVGRDVSGESGVVDLSKVKKLGNGPKYLSGVPSTTLSADQISVDLTDVSTNWDEPDAEIYLLAINKTLNQIKLIDTGSTHSDGEFSVSIPAGWTVADDITVFVTAKVTKFKPGSDLAESIQ